MGDRETELGNLASKLVSNMYTEIEAAWIALGDGNPGPRNEVKRKFIAKMTAAGKCNRKIAERHLVKACNRAGIRLAW